MRIKPLSVKLRAFSCPQGRCRMDHAEQFCAGPYMPVEKERKVVLDKGMKLPPALQSLQSLQSLQRVTQRGIKFIRWLRMFLFSPAPWCHMLATLRTLYQRH
jgi:hypothetical protein